MEERTGKENRILVDFWDRTFARSLEQGPSPADLAGADPGSLAPSEKLRLAAASLGTCRRVLDYGCGSGWAAVIAAVNGCACVTAADAAPRALEAGRRLAAAFGVSDRISFLTAGEGWLASLPAGSFDGAICSNVLDVVPPETAREILRGLWHAAAEDAEIVIGLNHFVSPEAARAGGMEMSEDGRLYVDGVLRLVSRTDEAWAETFAPLFEVTSLDRFAWPGEPEERRRLFRLRKLPG